MLDDLPVTPFISFESDAAWTTDLRTSLTPEDVRQRIELLAGLSARFPQHIRGWDDRGLVNAGPFRVSSERRNLWARWSVLLPFTIIGAPVGLLFGMAAARAYRNGEATNLATAVWGIGLSLAGTVLLVFGGINLMVADAVGS